MKTAGMLIAIALLAGGTGLSRKTSFQIPPTRKETTSPDCKCYCKGTAWPIGSVACMGGFKHRCNNRTGGPGIPGGGGMCGWDPVKQGNDQVRCDGAEHCK